MTRSTLSRRVVPATLVPATLLPAIALAATLTGSLAPPAQAAPSAPAGARHRIGAADAVHRSDITTLGWSTRKAEATTYEDLGTSQSTIEPCQRASLYAASGHSDVYTSEIYGRPGGFAGESVTQVDSIGTARRLAGRLERQIGRCGLWQVRTDEQEILPRGASARWYRLSNRRVGSRYQIAGTVRVGRRVALVGLTPQHRISDAQIEAFVARAVQRLR